MAFSPIDVSSYPNPRHLEIYNTGRRNFNGNLSKKPSILVDTRGFNPVVTPSDFPGRQSSGKGGVPPRHNEKGNKKDQTLERARVRSAAILKGTNNFVTSKMAAASSRRKLLVERSELFQTFVSSFSSEKMKPIPLLFLLLVVCLWRTTRSPLVSSKIGSSTGKESSFIELYQAAEVVEFETTNLAQLTRNLSLWSNNTSPCFSEAIPTVKESNELSFLRFGNFSTPVKEKNLQWPVKEMGIGNFQLKGQGSLVPKPYANDEEASQVNLEFEDAKPQIKNNQSKLEQALQGKSRIKMQHTEEESDLISHEAHNILPEMGQEGQVSLAFEVVTKVNKLWGKEKMISDAKIVASNIIAEKEQKAQVPQASEIKSELPPAEKVWGENLQIFKVLCLSLKEKSSYVYFLGFSFLILILTVAADFIFSKQQKSHNYKANVIPLNQLQAELIASMPTGDGKNTHQERLSTRNWLTEVGKSCPSQMSNFQRTTSYGKKESKGVSEAQSQERGLRKSNKREFLTSSSECSKASPSCGSRTSYEKIKNKHGCGDQEVVTSVWRSSRIKNQVPKSKNDSECLSEIISNQLLPPYDPKTGYLAPKPQLFNHHPNWRIERICLKEEYMELKDCFTSASLSDVQTSEEMQSENSPSVEIIEEQNEERKELKFKNDSEFLSKTAAGIDVCSKTTPGPPSLASCAPAGDANPSVAPYDPKTNYLAPTPRFLHYKPNQAIEKIHLRECKLLDDCFASESLFDNEISPETQSEVKESSSIALVERQWEGVKESETSLEETAQEGPKVSTPRTIKGKGEPLFKLELIPLLLLLTLFGCLWVPITDSQLINSVIDSYIGKELRFITKLYRPAELTELPRANFNGITRNFRLWSTYAESDFSKMIPTVKESNELSFFLFGNFTYSHVDIVGGVSVAEENKNKMQWPVMDSEIGSLQLKEQVVLVTEAYVKCGEASEVTPEFEDAKLAQQTRKLEHIQEELNGSHIDIQKASLSKPELEKENTSLKEEYNGGSHIDIEQASLTKLEVGKAYIFLKDECVDPHNSEVKQTKDEGKLVSHEIQSVLAVKEKGGEFAKVFEVELEAEEPKGEEKLVSEAEVEPEAEDLHDEEKAVSHADVEEFQYKETISDSEVEPKDEEVHGEDKLIFDAEVVASHSDHEDESIIVEKDQKAQVPQVSEIKSELAQAGKFPCKDKLISNAEVESNGAVFDPINSESEVLTDSQIFKEIYLSLKQNFSAVEVWISLLILVLTLGEVSIAVKQQKSPSSRAFSITANLFLAKKLPCLAAASVENSHKESLCLRNWLADVDMAGQSCPSEMSSFQRTASYQKSGSNGTSYASEHLLVSSTYSKKELKEESEALNQRRGLRKSNKRESLALSSDISIGSTFCGSFTSYEKISHKHGYGGQELVPVRRSCRIKNKVSSS